MGCYPTRQGHEELASFFLLDFDDPQRPRPLDFAEPYFNFGHPCPDYGGDFSTVVPENPEGGHPE